MKLVIFGLSISSSWGNGHATLWRALLAALARRGHRAVFYERDAPWYAENRDLAEQPGCEIVLYEDWEAIRSRAARDLREAEASIVTSYCPDGPAASELVVETGRGARLFYDLDTPVTLAGVARGERPAYLPRDGLRDFDLVLSFTGGAALDGLRTQLGARHVLPLYGSVDPAVHRPAPPAPQYRADLSYIGTYAADRQPVLERLLVEPARRLPERRFVIAGAQYPRDFPWTSNIWFVRHLPPAEHAPFYAASRATLNVTRADMAALGYCPSGRLFEAAACGVPLLSDRWPGLETFYLPGEEILFVEDPEDTIAVLDCLTDEELRQMAMRARERTLAVHTADRRARELEQAIEAASRSSIVHPISQGAVPCGV
jgi:spore maturation protein CgeB